MKSRQISRIHFFSISLQLQWLYVIGAPFLNSERSSTGFDLHLVTTLLHKYGELFWIPIYLFGVVFELISSQ